MIDGSRMVLPFLHCNVCPICGYSIAFNAVMCPEHWRIVPMKMRRSVVRARMESVDAYRDSRRTAIDLVRQSIA